MRNCILFLISMSFWTIQNAQPLADLSGFEVGDSVLVEVKNEIRKEYKRDNGELSYKEKRLETITYSLYLLSRNGGEFRFKVKFERFRNHHTLRYEGLSYHKRNEYSGFDSDFDRDNSAWKYIEALIGSSVEVLVNIEGQNHIIFRPSGEKKSGNNFSTPLNPKGLSNHINALFFVKKHPIQNGSISAHLIPSQNSQITNISGKIIHSLDNIISISGSPQRTMLDPLSQRLSIDPEGNFQASMILDKASFVYLFLEVETHPITKLTDIVKIPVFLEPGDDLQFSIDLKHPDEIRFEGNDAKKFELIDEMLQTYFHKYSYSENRAHIFWGFQGLPITKAGFFSQLHPKFYFRKAVYGKYTPIMNFLEENRTTLGQEAYYALKTEIIYSYAVISLAANILEENDAEEISNSGFTFTNLNKLTLTENLQFYLDSLGLRLEDVKNSYAYPCFLAAYLNTNSIGIRKSTFASIKDMMGSYYLSRYAYKGFALQCYLKNNILSWLDHNQSLSLFDDLSKDRQVSEERKLVISHFKKICRHAPFLNEVALAELKFKGFEKGNSAPIMKLNDSKQLSDYFGQKLALVFFRNFEERSLIKINNLAQENPEVKFIFLSLSPSEREFQALRQNKEFGDLLFHSPGYGSNQDRPFYIPSYNSFNKNTYFLIDEEGKLWGTDSSKTHTLVFEREVKELAAYRANSILKLWDTYKQQIALVALSFLVFLALLGIYWFFFIRNKRIRERKKGERIETELRAIRSQMNPHFLFNSLSSVQNLINQAEPEKANHYLSRFSQLMRKVLSHSEQSMIPLAEELKVVDLYCELEALRFTFEYKIEVDPQIDAHLAEIPSMLIQPYVENSVRHGLAMQKSGGFIGVYVKKKEDYIEIEIEDNGIGIRKHMDEFRGHVEKSGFGLRLSDERIKKINERYKMDISVKIFDRRDDLEPGHGTRVRIIIPIEI